MMTVHEIADYLRVKERKIYDLIAPGLPENGCFPGA
jgi:excisionase family DNA binding protein